jgi:ribonuclease P protein component
MRLQKDMFKKLHRFHGYGSVRAVYAKGKTVRGGQLGLKVSQRSNDKPYRVAVVVSKKVHKSAVVRNRIRRRVYEAVRTSSLELPNGIDLVFTVYSEQLSELPNERLAATVHDLTKKALETT